MSITEGHFTVNQLTYARTTGNETTPITGLQAWLTAFTTFATQWSLIDLNTAGGVQTVESIGDAWSSYGILQHDSSGDQIHVVRYGYNLQPSVFLDNDTVGPFRAPALGNLAGASSGAPPCFAIAYVPAAFVGRGANQTPRSATYFTNSNAFRFVNLGGAQVASSTNTTWVGMSNNQRHFWFWERQQSGTWTNMVMFSPSLYSPYEASDTFTEGMLRIGNTSLAFTALNSVVVAQFLSATGVRVSDGYFNYPVFAAGVQTTAPFMAQDLIVMSPTADAVRAGSSIKGTVNRNILRMVSASIGSGVTFKSSAYIATAAATGNTLIVGWKPGNTAW